MLYNTLQPKKVSVVTVSLNDAQRLLETQLNICNQSWTSIERVVIDGGSTDGSLEKLTRTPPDILISEPDGGIYDAMEKGARLATGDIVYFLNAGDLFHDSYVVEDVVKFFEETGCDAAFGNLMPKQSEHEIHGDHPAFRHGKKIDFSYFNNRRRFYDECIHHQATFYSRRIFNSCSFLCKEDLLTSGEYYLNVCAFIEKGFLLKHIPRVIADFRLGGRSTADFRVEWDRFVHARCSIRSRFFPFGPRVRIHQKNEYLMRKPRLANRVRIAMRDFGQLAQGNDWYAQLRYRLFKGLR